MLRLAGRIGAPDLDPAPEGAPLDARHVGPVILWVLRDDPPPARQCCISVTQLLVKGFRRRAGVTQMSHLVRCFLR